MRAAINQQLTESGEKEKLKAMIRERLRDHGWADNLKQYTKGKNNRKKTPLSESDYVFLITFLSFLPFLFFSFFLFV